MPLIVEDGTGRSDAQTYATLDQANDAATTLGDTEWLNATAATREQALARAANYVDNGMIYRYSGSIAYAQQVRAWPRRDAVLGRGGPTIATGVIPVQLVQGQIAAALLARAGLLPTQAATGPGRTGEISKVSAEGVSVDFADPTRAPSGNPALQTMSLGHPLVTGILAPLLDEYVHRFEGRSPISGAIMTGTNKGAFWEGMHAKYAAYAGVHSEPDLKTGS